jgi:ribonuclease HII
LIKNSQFEESLYLKGYKYIGGVDEVGRGCLAGVLVVGSVILKENPDIVLIDDSKKLNKKQREESFLEVLKNCVSFNLCIINNEVVDEINILESTKLGMESVITTHFVKPSIMLVDALKLDLDIPTLSIIHGDALSYSIGASSILAKVFRDEYMNLVSRDYPMYDFNHNVGYGTKKHIQAINQYGLTKIHRKTFKLKNSHYIELKLFD